MSVRLENQMDEIVAIGKAGGWSQAQYREALRQIVREARKLLRSGDRALNRVKHPSAE